MSWLERNEKYLALAMLFLVWPAVDSYQQGGLAGTSLGLAAWAVVAYSLIYAWHCLHGYRIQAPVTTAGKPCPARLVAHQPPGLLQPPVP